MGSVEADAVLLGQISEIHIDELIQLDLGIPNLLPVNLIVHNNVYELLVLPLREQSSLRVELVDRLHHNGRLLGSLDFHLFLFDHP